MNYETKASPGVLRQVGTSEVRSEREGIVHAPPSLKLRRTGENTAADFKPRIKHAWNTDPNANFEEPKAIQGTRTGIVGHKGTLRAQKDYNSVLHLGLIRG